MKLSDVTGGAPVRKLSDIGGGAALPDQNSDIPQPHDIPDKPKPTGILNQILTQGGRVDPATAKEQLGQDVMTGLESTAGMGPTPSAVGKVAAPVLHEAGKAVGDAASGAGKAIGEGAAHLIGGLGTHTGAESIKQAAKAGYEGGQKAEAFLGALRGDTPMESVIESAKEALSHMREARNTAYRSGMIDVKNDASVLKFDDIDKALGKVEEVGTFKGKPINPKGTIHDEIRQSIDEWKSSDPAEFHTAEGLDALKRRIGALRESTLPNTQDRLVADRVYDAVKSTIVKQAPTYAETMKDYEKASDQLRELERAFSIGEKGKPSADTALRKLQSIMRNNVSTNYGNRLKLAKTLEEEGGVSILPQLAGHALSSVTPRGLGGAVAGLTGLESVTHPAAAALLPFQSPRLMGEAAYYGGKGARGVSDIAASLGEKLKAIPPDQLKSLIAKIAQSIEEAKKP